MAAFSSLRLSTSAYNKHKKSEGGSSSNDYLLESGTGVLNITGYDEEARTVIEQSVEDEQDSLEIPFNDSDSVGWVLMRIQDELRIPTQHWSIVVEGGLLIGWYSILRALPAFWGSERVDAVLVPAGQFMQWKKEQSKKSQNKANWKFLQPGSTKSSNEGKQAAAIYHLISPTASTSSVWARYMAQRKAADKKLVRVLREQECGECESLLQQIKHGVGNILHDTELDRTQILSVVDGVIPLNIDVDDEDGDGRGLTEAKVYTRTYSSTKPSAVDVYFTWRSHARYDNVDLTSEVLYRICDPISTDKLDIPDKRIKAGTGGWKHLLSMSMKPGSRSREGERSYNATWSVKPTDVDKIHKTLFAPNIDIEKLQTMRIIFASVGILIRAARKANEEDGDSPDGLGKFGWWDHHEWVATQLRKACGVSLKRDAPKKTKKPKEKKWSFEDEIPRWVGKPEPIPRDYSDSDSDDSEDSY